jgi:alkylation response protein AidB-like acyl-CoA dehydrogenase
MTEPSGGSDLAALKTTAVRDGDDWLPQERLSNAIGSIAQAAQILDETLEYVKERKGRRSPWRSNGSHS